MQQLAKTYKTHVQARVAEARKRHEPRHSRLAIAQMSAGLSARNKSQGSVALVLVSAAVCHAAGAHSIATILAI